MGGWMNNTVFLTTDFNKPLIHWPSWLQQKILLAREQHAHMNLPNRDNELWRYANLKRLLELETNPIDFSAQKKGIDDSQLTVVIDERGHHIFGSVPMGVEIRHFSLIPESFFSDVPMTEDYAFNMLNLAFISNGIWVHVDAIKPIKLKVVYDYKTNHLVHLRNFFHVRKNSSIELQEVFSRQCRMTLVNDNMLGPKSRMKKHQLSVLQDQSAVIQYSTSTLGKGAQMECFSHHENGAFQHHIHEVFLQKKKSSFSCGSVNKASGRSNISDIVTVSHQTVNTQCRVVHRSLADDDSQLFNNVKSIINEGADGSMVEQDLKNILLSNRARMSSKPELEVNTDEVVASHGSTIGALPAEQLFYLQSRGIEQKRAKQILIESFLEEAKIC